MLMHKARNRKKKETKKAEGSIDQSLQALKLGQGRDHLEAASRTQSTDGKFM